MKANFLFLTGDGDRIYEGPHDCDFLPRIGETVLTAPDVTPEGTPDVEPPNPPSLWKVVDICYLLSNHGQLCNPTITLKHMYERKELEISH